MAFSQLPFDSFCRCWPFLLVSFLGLAYLAHLEIFTNPFLSLAGSRKIQSSTSSGSPNEATACNLPSVASSVLVHYATTTIMPQQTKEEISITANILTNRGPCNFLVFGLGFDSPMWHALNAGGKTVFLEEDSSWIRQTFKAHPYLKAYHIKYTTMLKAADQLLAEARKEKEICGADQGSLKESKCKLALKTLPDEIYNTTWDVIMIDAPKGYFPEAPGRMGAVFTAAVMARARERQKITDIMIHDVDRPVENTYSTEFFCSKNLIEQVGRLRHFRIYGEGQARSSSFCTHPVVKSPG